MNPPLKEDLLTGAQKISDYLGDDWSPRKVYYAADKKLLPIGYVGRMLIARKSELDKALSATAKTAEVA